MLISFPGENFRRKRRGGFTIIEILVSCAVLATLVVLLASAFSNFVGLANSSNKRMEISNQNNTSFDRMAFDVGSAIKNGGIEIDFHKNAQLTSSALTPNDSMLLLTDARSTTTKSRLAKIGYEVGSDQNNATQTQMSSLVRCVEPFLWSDTPLAVELTNAVERQSLGRGVFRMEICFLKKDGSIVADPPKQDEIASIVVSTATLDENTYSRLSGAERGLLASVLPDAVDGRLPLSDWNPNRFSSLPATVTQRVQFSQRQFDLQ